MCQRDNNPNKEQRTDEGHQWFFSDTGRHTYDKYINELKLKCIQD